MELGRTVGLSLDFGLSLNGISHASLTKKKISGGVGLFVYHWLLRPCNFSCAHIGCSLIPYLNCSKLRVFFSKL